MNWLLRAIVLLYVIVATFAGVARIELAERNVPFHSDIGFTLNVNEAQVTKGDVAEELSRIASETSGTIALVGRDQNDVTQRGVYYFGPHHPEPKWFNQDRVGVIEPFHELSSRQVNGTYAIWDAPEAWDEIQQCANQHGVIVELLPAESPIVLTQMAVTKTMAIVPLLALVLALAVTMMAIATRQADANTQKLLNGVSALRIASENSVSALVTTLVTGVLGVAIASAWILATADGTYLQPFLEGMTHLFLPLLGLVLLLSFAVSTLTWPSVVSISERRNPIRHVRPITEIFKIVSLACVIVLTPQVAVKISDAVQSHAEGTVWKQFDNVVAVNNFGTVPGEPEDEAAATSFREIVIAADASDELLYSFNAEDAVATDMLDQAQLSSVYVVNSAYLQTATGLSKSEIDRYLESPNDAVTTFLEASKPGLELQIAAEQRESVDPFTVFQPRQWTGPAIPFISNKYLAAMNFESAPLLLIVDDHSEMLDPNFLMSATSRSGVMFTDESNLRQALSDAELDEGLRNIDSVADVGLIDLQNRQQLLTMQVTALILLAVAAIECVWASARTYVLSHSERFLPFAISGVPVRTSLRPRFIFEMTVIAVLTLAGVGVAGLIGAPLWSVLATVLVGLTCTSLSLLAHRREYQLLVDQRLVRAA